MCRQLPIFVRLSGRLAIYSIFKQLADMDVGGLTKMSLAQCSPGLTALAARLAQMEVTLWR